MRVTCVGIQDRNGALFFISINIVMAAAFGVLAAFVSERNVFERERSESLHPFYVRICVICVCICVCSSLSSTIFERERSE